MFYYINGTLEYRDASTCVLDCGGVGYKLTVSLNTSDFLTNKQGEKVKLYTHLAVREDGIELFGFASEEELSSFKMLITVSGVGPKAALAILSQMTPTKLAIAVCTEDKKAISKANGIGPKTAARIILELKDKLKKEAVTEGNDVVTADEDFTYSSSKRKDAEDALAVLGYSRSEASAALRALDTENLELDEIIRLALKKLMR